MREKPKDPITDERDWDPVMGADPYATDGNTEGLIDVHSKSNEVSTEATPYREW